MKITILYSENNPSDYHRLLQPVRYMSKVDEIRLVEQTKISEEENVFDCDIVWFSRIFIYDIEKLQQLKDKYGFKIVVDFDDYYALQPRQLRYKLWVEHNVEKRMIQAAGIADLVFVTNWRLKDIYRQFNQNIVIVPNGVVFSDDNPYPSKPIAQRIKFLYAAGATHYNDFRLLTGLFQKLRGDSQYKTKASFTFCGYNDKIVETKKMESIAYIVGSYERRNIMSVNTYMEHYQHGDISIAPLENNFYNNCKSNLKFIESASTKLPFICSTVFPYLQDIEQHSGIFFCSNTNEWYKAFKFFLNNREAIKEYGESNYQYAKDRYNLLEINKIRTNEFKKLVNNLILLKL